MYNIKLNKENGKSFSTSNAVAVIAVIAVIAILCVCLAVFVLRLIFGSFFWILFLIALAAFLVWTAFKLKQNTRLYMELPRDGGKATRYIGITAKKGELMEFIVKSEDEFMKIELAVHPKAKLLEIKNKLTKNRP